jgi:hypothetical protein
MKSPAILLTAFALLAAPVLAENAPDDTFVRTTDAGHEVRISAYVQYSNNCTSAGDPHIEVKGKPAHGSVTVRSASIVVTRSRSGNCLGYTLPGLEVWYTPEAGFQGSDRFDYDVYYTKNMVHEAATVAVQAPSGPAASPSPSASPSPR